MALSDLSTELPVTYKRLARERGAGRTVDHNNSGDMNRSVKSKGGPGTLLYASSLKQALSLYR